MSKETKEMGRPKKLQATKTVFDFIEGLAAIFCTQKEAAKVFSVSRSTFCMFLAKHRGGAGWQRCLHSGAVRVAGFMDQQGTAKAASATG